MIPIQTNRTQVKVHHCVGCSETQAWLPIQQKGAPRRTLQSTHCMRYRRLSVAWSAERPFSGAIRSPGNAVSIRSPIPSCGSGSASLRQTGRCSPRRARETRLDIWHRHRTHLEAYAWEELCRMAVSNLHRTVPAITAFGPLGEARRYWRGKEPELDVARRASAPPSRTRVADLVVSCSRRIGRGTTPMSSTREWCSKHSVGAIAVRRRKPKDRCVSPLQETYEIFDQAGREFRQASSDVIGAFAGTIRESLGVRVEGSLDTNLKRHT